ncbi:hypothetical protein BDEG_20392 [Batrachochytrium dendrobatidis JEL423]|uniref:Uncharacterized protein n=1 Tax=Batrachochytrium dendrobatidis (strain JEL423) TaxID=403673 RepID=A0A177W7W8_BATDL|nr:hypothetical protein BDEG_20392 [Batrachochytrium dendrobatidis JEL423]
MVVPIRVEYDSQSALVLMNNSQSGGSETLALGKGPQVRSQRLVAHALLKLSLIQTKNKQGKKTSTYKPRLGTGFVIDDAEFTRNQGISGTTMSLKKLCCTSISDIF